MPPLTIRYKPIFTYGQLIMALLLLFLAFYTGSMYRAVLAAVWMIIVANNMLNNSVLDVTETEILVKNSLGMISKRYVYQEGAVEVRDKQIFFDKQKIFSHSFFFSEEDFEKVREYLTLKNPELNLGRHLVDDD